MKGVAEDGFAPGTVIKFWIATVSISGGKFLQ